VCSLCRKGVDWYGTAPLGEPIGARGLSAIGQFSTPGLTLR
jgi:hypothetical protein